MIIHPPSNYNLRNTPLNKLSPRQSQKTALFSPPSSHLFSYDDTNFDITSYNSPIHNVSQSTKIYPLIPLPIKFNDIPLTSVSPKVPLNFIHRVAYRLIEI